MPSRSRGDAMVAVIAALLIAALQQPTALTIGSASARPGPASSGVIAVPAGCDAATRIPISIVRAVQAAPTIALIARTHRSEVTPIVALQRHRALIYPDA